MDALVEVLELLDIPRFSDRRLPLHLPTISGNTPRVKEPNPSMIIAPILPSRSIVEFGMSQAIINGLNADSLAVYGCVHTLCPIKNSSSHRCLG